MARQDDFIGKLDDFTSALEDLVDTLKDQQKKGPTEVVNSLLENLDAEKISMIAENVEEIKNNTKTIVTNQDKILAEVKAIKQQKETGMMGEIEKKESKNTILEGVKTIMLIAGGVLAIGLAFKIVGRVDFFSVVSLGLSIYLMAETFSKIADMKELTMKKVLMIGLTLPLMATSLLVSGLILKQMPDMSIYQLLTIGAIGITIGISTYLLLKSIENLKPKSLKMIPMLPLIIPVVAASLVAAGAILNQMPIVGLMQVVSALAVSVALTPIMISFGFMAKSIKNVSIKELILMPLIIPGIAAALVASSYILKEVQPIDFVKVAVAGAGVGLATLAMVPTIMLLKKAKLLEPNSLISLGLAVIALPLISLAIVGSSYILNLGDYGKYPPLEWTLGVGLSLIAFSIPMVAIGLLAMAGVGLPALALGLIAIPIVVATIVAASLLLPFGTYENYPSLEWSAGVGLALLAFGLPIVTLGTFILASFGLGIAAIASGVAGVLLIASTIAQASHLLKEGDYTSSYPSVEWSKGVALSISAFSDAMWTISNIGGFLGFGGMDVNGFTGAMVIIVRGLIAAAEEFNKSGVSVFDPSMVPSKAWAEGVALSVSAFSDALNTINDIGSFLGFGGMDADEFGATIVLIVKGIIDAGKAFNEAGVDQSVFDLTKVPSKEWSEGVGTVLSSFSEILRALVEGDIELDDKEEVAMISEVMKTLARGVVSIGLIFNENPNAFSVYPNEEWVSSIGDTMKTFGKIITSDFDEDKAESFINIFGNYLDSITYMNKVFSGIDAEIFGEGGIANLVSLRINELIKAMPNAEEISPIIELANALNNVSEAVSNMASLSEFSSDLEDVMDALSDIDVNKVNSLVNFGVGLNALSLVDNVKLNKTIDLLEAKKNEMTSVIEDSGVNFLDQARNMFGTGGGGRTNIEQTNVTSGKSEDKDKDKKFKDELLEHVSKIDDNIEKMAKLEEKFRKLEGEDVNT